MEMKYQVITLLLVVAGIFLVFLGASYDSMLLMDIGQWLWFGTPVVVVLVRWGLGKKLNLQTEIWSKEEIYYGNANRILQSLWGNVFDERLD